MSDTLGVGIVGYGTAAKTFHLPQWDNGNIYLERLLREGALGKVSLCVFHYSRFRPDVAKRWREEGADHATLVNAEQQTQPIEIEIEIEIGTYEKFYAGVAACLIDGAESPVSLTTARNVMALIEASFSNAREGRRVALKNLL